MRLSDAAEKDDPAELEALLEEHTDDIDAKTESGDTALILAAQGGFCRAAAVLVDKGAALEVKAGHNGGDTALDLAVVRKDNAAMVKILLEAGAKTNNAIVIAADRGRTATVKQLIEHDDDLLRAKDKHGWTMLIRVAASRPSESAHMIRQLVDGGADLEVKTNKGETALVKAIGSGHFNFEAVKTLLDMDADSKAKDKHGNTVLAMAVNDGFTAAVTKLLALHQHLLEAKSTDGKTPLVKAAAQENVKMMRVLIDKGAKVDAKDKDGKTALMVAAANGRAKAVRLLLAEESDLEAQDNSGKRAFDHAQGLDRALKNQLKPTSKPKPAKPAEPSEYLCPITKELMKDPVITVDGHTYERDAIEKWFLKSNRSPMTTLTIKTTLIPNLAVRTLIDKFNKVSQSKKRKLK